MAKEKKVTILVPNYKTPEITKICLRLLRKFTDFSQVEVVVIDNNSQDASLTYLRGLSWIKLVERQPAPDDTVPLSHSRALDLALAEVKTPFVLSIHTDTFVKRSDWLDVLLKPFDNADDYYFLKLFPAVAVGGINLLKGFAGPFADVKFCPTGGVSVESAPQFLALPNVVVCGGTWLTPADAVANKDWAHITKLAKEASAIAAAK